MATGVIHSSADILAVCLLNGNIVSDPNDNRDWPVWVFAMPDKPNDVVAIYDGSGIINGRDMRGYTSEFLGWQIRLRSRFYKDGIAKLKQIVDYLSTIHNVDITIDNILYRVIGVHRTAPVSPSIQEEGGGRLLFYTSGIMSVVRR